MHQASLQRKEAHTHHMMDPCGAKEYFQKIQLIFWKKTVAVSSSK